jgi:hypothetical protein
VIRQLRVGALKPTDDTGRREHVPKMAGYASDRAYAGLVVTVWRRRIGLTEPSL